MTPRRTGTAANPLDVGRRERQIIEVVYRLGRASVADVLEANFVSNIFPDDFPDDEHSA